MASGSYTWSRKCPPCGLSGMLTPQSRTRNMVQFAMMRVAVFAPIPLGSSSSGPSELMHAAEIRRVCQAPVSSSGRYARRRCGVRRVLPPLDFGQPVGDMGSLRIQLARPLKGSDRVGKLPLS